MSEKVKVYVWEIPVRLTHWLNVVSLIALSITGYYVSDPFIHAQSSEQYIMGWMRFIHFVSAYTFLMSLIIRIYWSFVGNKYARLSGIFPYSGKGAGEIPKEIKFYLTGKDAPSVVGHTALGGLAMTVVFCIFAFTVFSGYALYSVTHTGAIWTLLGGWLLGYMDLQTIRLWHHLSMYALIVFTLVHIYIVVYSDRLEENSLLSSIFCGNKNVTGNEPDI